MHVKARFPGRAGRCRAGVIAGLAIGVACGSSGGVDLRYDLARGDALAYDVVQELDGELVTAQGTTEVDLRIASTLGIEALAADGDRVTLEMRSVRSSASVGGVDVDVPTPPAYRVVLDRETGEILSVDADDSLGSSPTLLTFLPQLPGRRVDAGDEWLVRRELSVGGERLELSERSTLRQAESEGPVVLEREIELPIVAELPLQRLVPVDLAAVPSFADAAIRMRGTVRVRTEDLFDPDRHQWLRSAGTGSFDQVGQVVGVALEVEDAINSVLGRPRVSGSIRTSVTAVDPTAAEGS